MASVSPESNPIGYLRSAEAIRARCKEVYDLGVAGKLDHFIVRPERLDWLAGMVKGETLRIILRWTFLTTAVGDILTPVVLIVFRESTIS